MIPASRRPRRRHGRTHHGSERSARWACAACRAQHARDAVLHQRSHLLQRNCLDDIRPPCGALLPAPQCLSCASGPAPAPSLCIFHTPLCVRRSLGRVWSSTGAAARCAHRVGMRSCTCPTRWAVPRRCCSCRCLRASVSTAGLMPSPRPMPRECNKRGR